MDDADRRLIRTAAESTRAGRVVWELYPEDAMIRAKFGRTILRITPELPAYRVVVHETFVRPPDESLVSPDAPDFLMVDEVYRLGRAVARDTDVVMEERLQALGK